MKAFGVANAGYPLSSGPLSIALMPNIVNNGYQKIKYENMSHYSFSDKLLAGLLTVFGNLR